MVIDQIEEPTLLDSVLHYGLFLGAIFQLVCIFAVIVVPKSQEERDLDNNTTSAKNNNKEIEQSPLPTSGKKKRDRKKTR